MLFLKSFHDLAKLSCKTNRSFYFLKSFFSILQVFNFLEDKRWSENETKMNVFTAILGKSVKVFESLSFEVNIFSEDSLGLERFSWLRFFIFIFLAIKVNFKLLVSELKVPSLRVKRYLENLKKFVKGVDLIGILYLLSFEEIANFTWFNLFQIKRFKIWKVS